MSSASIKLAQGFVAIVVDDGGELSTPLVQRLAQAGATVLEIGDSGTPRSDAVASRLVVDLDDWNDTEECLASIARAHGRIDCFIQLSPASTSVPFLDATRQNFRTALQSGLERAFMLSRHVARHMAASGGGSILQLITSPPSAPAAGHALSLSVQSAIAQLSRGMSIDLARVNIRSNAIMAPPSRGGPARSGCAGHEAGMARLSSPLLGEVSLDIADAVLFLSASVADGISGQVFQARPADDYVAALRGGWISGHDQVARGGYECS